jgi:energy-coupling factor transporter ATP-binding protein EcfA2
MGHFNPMVIYRNPDDSRENSIIRYIGNRVNSEGKKNFLCFVTGQTGMGKSYSAISMAEIYANMYNIEFNPECHIITSLKELLQLITEPEESRKIKFGSVIVFDEPQVEGSATDWQSDINKALSQLVSTFRNQRLVVFFACPYKEMVSKSVRILFHGEFRVEGYDIKTKMSQLKPRFLEWNDKKQDFYYKRLIVQYKEQGKQTMTTSKLHQWHIPLASQALLDAYEAKKKKFTDELNKKLLRSIEMQEKRVEGTDKSHELFMVEELFDKFGEDYRAILTEMPHLTPYTLERYIYYIKKSRKMLYTRQKKPENPRKT